MALTPFGDQFPLADNSGVYNSRISEFLSRPVNYVFTGFKPGYALQASELNELQEQFFLQQTLSNRCVFNWLTYTGTPKPFWEGCTPLSPTQIDVSNSGPNIQINLSAGWYYITDKRYSSSGIYLNSGIGFWIYSSALTLDVLKDAVSTNPSSPSKIGLIYSFASKNTSDDETLNDNSNSTNVIMEVPGADRILVDGLEIQKYTSQTVFSDILTIVNTSGSYLVKYLDGTTVATINGQ
jgi:hypothetical protein